MAEQLDPLTGLPTNVIKQTSTNPNSTGTVLKGTDPLTGLPAEVITSAKPAIAPKVGLGFGSSISQNLRPRWLKVILSMAITALWRGG